jgi:alpha-beta hydrolase superfamily lysophospholipase
MMDRAEAEVPRFFGANGELFGVYHTPARPATRAALLCPPLGQDHIRCHRLYRQLARALAAEGVAVLRFDYYGVGDSAGGSAETDWNRCIADVLTAAAELRVLSGCEQLLAFGARLGGSLALATSNAAAFAELIVWDPILDGATHVSRLDALQTAMRLDKNRFQRPRSADDAAGQWLGFAIGTRLRQQLVELRIELPATRTLLLNSLSTGLSNDTSRLADAGATARSLESSTPWDDLSRLELAILSHELIHRVTTEWKNAP